MGRYTTGITEKRMQNRRFRKTEEAILRVVSGGDVYIGTKEMASKAGVARSTFYHHHKTVREIVPDYKRYILQKYVRLVNKMMRQKGAGIRKMYGKMLIFMMQHKPVFKMLLKSDGNEIIKEMLTKLEPKAIKHMRIGKKMGKVLGIYKSEVVGLIVGWAEGDFNEKEMGAVIEDVMYLTETAKERLGPIVN